MGNSQPKKSLSESLGEPDVSNNDYSDDEYEQEDNVEQEQEQEQDEVEQEQDEEQEQEQVEPEEVSEQVEADQSAEQVEIPLSSIPVNDKNGAFQLLIAFINLAYARGAFKQDEVEKIIECINKFVV